MGLLILTLYLGVGDDFNPSNYINMAAVLFMWVVMPAFGAAAYVPAITLGEDTVCGCVCSRSCTDPLAPSVAQLAACSPAMALVPQVAGFCYYSAAAPLHSPCSRLTLLTLLLLLAVCAHTNTRRAQPVYA
jgi:hypothetical protein